MMKIVLILLLSLSTAHAQMGWTLEQCKKRFGKCTVNDSEHTAYLRLNAHRQVWLTFDSDGTVGKIEWLKPNGPYNDAVFPEVEIQRLLREASHVTWKQVTLKSDVITAAWTGEQNGKIIFDAIEWSNDRNTFFLTITTR